MSLLMLKLSLKMLQPKMAMHTLVDLAVVILSKWFHNGIEYGMMQAIGEGFDFMEQSDFELDFHQIAHLWNHGSIIESALIGNIESAFSKDPKLEEISGIIDDSGEGKWMIEEALDHKISIPVINASSFLRALNPRTNINLVRKSSQVCGRNLVDMPHTKRNKHILVVIFGATGDLTARKLLPALTNLYSEDFLPKIVVIALGRRFYDKFVYRFCQKEKFKGRQS